MPGEEVTYRNPKVTNWSVFREELQLNLTAINKAVKTVEQLELTVGELEIGLNDAYLRSCPIKKTAKRDGNWEAYRTALTTFNRELRKAKRRSWARFCEEVNNTSQTSRLYKVISKAPSSHPSTLKRRDGTYTKRAEETLRLLADVHFPNSIHLESNEAFSHTTIKTRPSSDDWRRASTIFKPDRVKWAIDSFKPYKTGGEDNIFPALLQQGKDIILPVLLKIFRASFAWGYIPLASTKVKVSYIPKSGDRDKALPKSYRPISLTSFMLKTMEKVVNLHIRDTYLTKKPLHERQHAYQKGKSTETALMDLVDRIDRAIEDKEIALCVFLDIEGAFDNTSTSFITNSLALRDMDQSEIS
ncbi:uncharacterized protein LOC121738430 [Aricia agestis]|uniref:uncharacterized protein LOC121738430 n=1 Tax=Aricia agestis TaxID=91739 RepID=UPI001C20A5CB|nr:uncharacterized protein LOC121738430 [Aricia agestis]